MSAILTRSSRVEEIAKARGISMAQVAIAWSLSKDVMTAPIIGTTNLKNLEDIASKCLSNAFVMPTLIHDVIVGAVHVNLTDEEIKRLEEPYLPQAIVGHS